MLVQLHLQPLQALGAQAATALLQHHSTRCNQLQSDYRNAVVHKAVIPQVDMVRKTLAQLVAVIVVTWHQVNRYG